MPKNNKQLTKDDMYDVLAEFYTNMIKPEFDKLYKRFDNLEIKVDRNHVELKGEVDSLKGDTPTRKEFDNLKSKVDRHHPSN